MITRERARGGGVITTSRSGHSSPFRMVGVRLRVRIGLRVRTRDGSRVGVLVRVLLVVLVRLRARVRFHLVQAVRQ